MPPVRPTTTLVVMGVAGAGKTTVMAALAARLRWPTGEADEFMPEQNVEKMRSGIPLTDDDRRPWLARIRAWIADRERASENAIVTCSALRRAYRDYLRDGHPSVWFAHLVVPPADLHERLVRRTGHYMPASLLGSQLATLEPLEPDEPGAAIDANGPTDVVVDAILTALAADRPGSVPATALAP
jgi:gluconokinase